MRNICQLHTLQVCYVAVHACSVAAWILFGDLPQPRSHCTTATLPTGEFLVIGGISTLEVTDTAYKCSLSFH